jgi:hypothetical protein
MNPGAAAQDLSAIIESNQKVSKDSFSVASADALHLA